MVSSWAATWLLNASRVSSASVMSSATVPTQPPGRGTAVSRKARRWPRTVAQQSPSRGAPALAASATTASAPPPRPWPSTEAASIEPASAASSQARLAQTRAPPGPDIHAGWTWASSRAESCGSLAAPMRALALRFSFSQAMAPEVRPSTSTLPLGPVACRSKGSPRSMRALTRSARSGTCFRAARTPAGSAEAPSAAAQRAKASSPETRRGLPSSTASTARSKASVQACSQSTRESSSARWVSKARAFSSAFRWPDSARMPATSASIRAAAVAARRKTEAPIVPLRSAPRAPAANHPANIGPAPGGVNPPRRRHLPRLSHIRTRMRRWQSCTP